MNPWVGNGLVGITDPREKLNCQNRPKKRWKAKKNPYKWKLSGLGPSWALNEEWGFDILAKWFYCIYRNYNKSY